MTGNLCFIQGGYVNGISVRISVFKFYLTNYFIQNCLFPSSADSLRLVLLSLMDVNISRHLRSSRSFARAIKRGNVKFTAWYERGFLKKPGNCPNHIIDVLGQSESFHIVFQTNSGDSHFLPKHQLYD